jgi:cation-transporting P-type ATPase 13A2
MTAYSMIQFTTNVILLAIGSVLGPWQFLFIDLFIVMPLAFVSEYTGAYRKLSKRRPVSSLLSREVLTSLLSQLAVNVIFQLVAFAALRTQYWY